MNRFRIAILLLLVLLMPVRAEMLLRIARIPGFPDQTVSSEILAEVYRRLGWHVEFVDLPAARALRMSRIGQLDGEVARIIDIEKQYPTLLPIRVPVNYIEPSAFTKRVAPTINGWESIQNYRLGIVQGVGSSERGTSGMKDVQAVASQDVLLAMLNADRMDIAVTDLFSGSIRLRALRLDNAIHALSPPLQHIDIYHYLHEQHRELVPKVETVMREMERSGELAALRERFRQQILDATLPN